MRGGALLLVIGAIAIYLGVSGKSCCFTQFLKCAVSSSMNPCECGKTQENATVGAIGSLPQLPRLPDLPSFSGLG